MFEFITNIFLEGRIKKAELEDQLRRSKWEKGLFEKTKELIESRYLDVLDDPDQAKWMSISADGTSNIAPADHTALQEQAYKMFYRYGHYRNIVRLYVKYITGRGFTVVAKCVSSIVKDFWEKVCTRNRMTRRVKELVKRLVNTGEVFVRIFKFSDGMIDFRFLDPARVKNPTDKTVDSNTTYGIETDPDDIEKVISYWYDGVKIPAEEIIHEKINVESDVKRGRPQCEPVMEEIVMYKDFLRTRMKLNKIRSLIGIVRKVSGSPSQVTAIANQYQTTRRAAPDGSSYMKTPEGVSIMTAGKNIDYDFKTPNLQAGDVHNDGAAILRSIAAGAGGLPEFMVTSDASNGSYASTMIAESPAVQEFIDMQESIEWVLKEMYRQVIQWGIDSRVLPEKITYEKIITKIDDITGKINRTVENITEEVSTDCDIVFPEIVHREIDRETNALALQRQNEIISKRTMAGRLDLDYDKEREQMKIEEFDEMGDMDDPDTYRDKRKGEIEKNPQT